MPTRALVTGGAGFIGSHICDALVQDGCQVVVLDDFSTGLRTNVNESATLVEGSILDRSVVEKAVEGCDTVFHLAASVSVIASVECPVDSFETNAVGTLNVAEVARRAGVRRLIYSASSAAYGDRKESPKRESIAPQPLSPYAAGKLAGEHVVTSYAHSYGMSTVSLRYFNIFGPRQRPDSPYAAAIPIFLSRLLAGESLVVYGDGEQTRDFTYIDNVVRANLRAAELPLHGEVINCASGESITVNRLIQELASITGKTPRIEFAPPRPGEARFSEADMQECEQILGLTERVRWQDGLRKTVEWMLSQAH